MKRAYLALALVLSLCGMASASVVMVDVAVGAKVTPAAAGWTEWVLPLGASASTSIPFDVAAGGSLGLTFARPNGDNYSNDNQIGASAPLAVMSDHIMVARTGKDNTDYTITLVGLPAGPTTFTLYGSYAAGSEYGPGYPGYTDSSRTWSMSANGGTPVTWTSWMTASSGSPYVLTFDATGNDVITVHDSYGYGTICDGFTIEAAAAPEPATLGVLLVGGLLTLARRRKA